MSAQPSKKGLNQPCSSTSAYQGFLIFLSYVLQAVVEFTARDTEVLEPLIKHWQNAGYMVKGSPEVIAGVIRSLFLLPLHYREIGEDLFPEVLEKYIDLLSCGLISEDHDQR